MIRWENPTPAVRVLLEPTTTAERARYCESLAVRLDRSGEAHSAGVARLLASGYRRAAA